MAGSAGAIELVKNGSLEISGYPAATTQNIVNFNPGQITDWQVHGAGALPWNAVYIYDDLSDAARPPFMPPSYYGCSPAFGFVAGNACGIPDGSNHFINLDGDNSFPGAISQSITGLAANQRYRLTFNWAVVQRDNETGDIYDNYLDVSVGDQHYQTPVIGDINNKFPTQGFTGWFTTKYDFNWNGHGKLLTFLAHGTPSGHPPSINLDGISLLALPEPPILALLSIASLGLIAAARRRR
jgi:hypothetical protein